MLANQSYACDTELQAGNFLSRLAKDVADDITELVFHNNNNMSLK